MTKSCAEATIELLSKYGVTTIFGIPGVHTLDFCRALTDKADDPNKILHVQARNEQGAGFMAEGWACLLYTSPSPRDYAASRMPSSA